jgi:hypothetical protein
MAAFVGSNETVLEIISSIRTTLSFYVTIMGITCESRCSTVRARETY